MKRTTRKLAVRSETVRALGAIDLARVGGGGALLADDSGIGCPAVAAMAADAAAARR